MSTGRAGIEKAMWRGTVVRVDENGRVYVTAKRLSRDQVFGPCPVAELPGAVISVGDRVFVSSVDGDWSSLAVIARIGTY